ncbi:MAG: hypothetical protein ABI186_03545 [Candidatus Elarobacter sp.]
MDNLVRCPCGHTLERHADLGCNGERGVPCPCTRSSFGALDAAVAQERADAPADPNPSLTRF